MPYARPVPARRTVMIDRRTTRRFFLLRPDADRGSQRIFWYCLAVIAARHGVLVHAAVQMSSHHHLVVTDVRGVLPDFLRDLHAAMAMALKCHRAWDEEVWNKSQTSVVSLETTEAIVGSIAYVATNPVEAGMVQRPAEHPGAITQVHQMGRLTLTIRRPDVAWFQSQTKWPKVVALPITLPWALESAHGEEGARRALHEAVEQRTAQLRSERAQQGLDYLGAAAVCRAPVTTRAKKKEPLRSRKPTFAVGPGQREARLRKIGELRVWRAAYATCLERWGAGERDILWPPNTWKMRVRHGVRCAPS